MMPADFATSILLCLPPLLVALAMAKWLPSTATATTGKIEPIEGLRGFLAFFVFLHHAYIWYGFNHTGQWQEPDSILFLEFGKSGVALFFMITGFLFFSKILDTQRSINWAKLFVGRLARLTPLYLFAMALLFATVILRSRFMLNEPPVRVIGEMMDWLAFTIPGAPNINGIERTTAIMAGVTWTLPYEWFFYLLLPLMALSLRSCVIPPAWATGLAAAGFVGLVLWGPATTDLIPFASGMIAAVIAKFKRTRDMAQKYASLGFGFGIAAFLTPPSSIQMLLLTLFFITVACGNSLMGLLTTSPALQMGRMAYSLYLLHGFLLYSIFTGPLRTATNSVGAYWTVVTLSSAVLVILCHASYRHIELRGMWLPQRLHPLFQKPAINPTA